jgi:hypothetical protein
MFSVAAISRKEFPIHAEGESERQRTPFLFMPSLHEVNVLWGGHACKSVSSPRLFRRNLVLGGI